VKELLYSEAEAAVRVNACRLIRSTPSVKTKIQTGAFSLTTASLLQTHFKKEKTTDIEKEKLVNTIEGKSKRESKVSESKSRYVPVNVKREVSKRSQHRCEYISTITGKRCSAITHLQFDHKIPFSKGGIASVQNMQHLCSCHNLRKGVS